MIAQTAMLLFLLVAACDAHGRQCQLGQISPEAAQGGDSFGWSIAADRNTCVVGAYYGGGNEFGTGTAHVFNRLGIQWIHQDTLFAADGVLGDYFGNAVAINGNQILIGAYRVDHGDSTGSVYIYTHDQQTGHWRASQTLTPPQPGVLGFGHSVAVSGPLALVGAFVNDHGVQTGHAYAYVRTASGWEMDGELIVPGDSAGMLGRSVALDGSRALIGAVQASRQHPDWGVAHIFERAGPGVWLYQVTLSADEANLDRAFGAAVALKGDWAAVGAFKDNDPAHESGAVYAFARQSDGEWLLRQRLVAVDGLSHDYFGYALAMQNNSLLVGAPFAAGPRGIRSGKVYAYQRSGDNWFSVAAFAALSGSLGDRLGFSVALAGPHAFGSANGFDLPLEDTGSAFVFAIGGCDGNGNGELDSCDIAVGFSPDLDQDGIADECQSTCRADCALPPDGYVNVIDLFAVIQNWGRTYVACDFSQPVNDGIVNIDDLLAVIMAWGRCR